MGKAVDKGILDGIQNADVKTNAKQEVKEMQEQLKNYIFSRVHAKMKQVDENKDAQLQATIAELEKTKESATNTGNEDASLKEKFDKLQEELNELRGTTTTTTTWRDAWEDDDQEALKIRDKANMPAGVEDGKVKVGVVVNWAYSKGGVNEKVGCMTLKKTKEKFKKEANLPKLEDFWDFPVWTPETVSWENRVKEGPSWQGVSFAPAKENMKKQFKGVAPQYRENTIQKNWKKYNIISELNKNDTKQVK